MAADKYTAVWVSHSSMGDFLKCPRAYFLHNVYKDPKTGRKVNMVSPALALGQAVHEVLENLSHFKSEERVKECTLEKLHEAWTKVAGKKGGFTDQAREKEAKARAEAMIQRVIDNPGIILEKAIKLPQELPNYFLSEDENIILCGKIDWLTHVTGDDSLRVLDFKTGKYDENGESLQLPIYQLLLNNIQDRKVSGASYWYLDRDNEPVSVPLPSLEDSYDRVIEAARKVKSARDSKTFLCPQGERGCFACQPFEQILKGNAYYVGVGEYNQDLYIVD